MAHRCQVHRCHVHRVAAYWVDVCVEVPVASGGDTLWSNQFLAYEGLSEPIRALIDGLTALHGRPAQTGTTTHPMVKSHPVNNRGRLSVNRGWTRAVASLSETDSRPLLAMLFDEVSTPSIRSAGAGLRGMLRCGTTVAPCTTPSMTTRVSAAPRGGPRSTTTERTQKRDRRERVSSSENRVVRCTKCKVIGS